ncbi:MAG: hypothetical protein ACK5NK_00400 [Niabella sp.]
MTDFQSTETPLPVKLDVYTKHSIISTAKVAGISAILSISSVVLGFIIFFTKPQTVAPAKEGFEESSAASIATGSSIASLLFSSAINILLFYYLYRFAKISRKALQANQPQLLETGLYSLSGYFKTSAILVIVSAGLLVLAVLAAGLGGAL